MTDNGPQFASAEFAVFGKTWMFQHTTSSPHYPQSNGKAENAVKTVKRLFTKCKESGQSEFIALLDWRNTPTKGVGTSPAQRLMGRRCKTLLPVAGALLQPRHSTTEETRALTGRKHRQQFYYDKHTKPLHPINTGETVRMKLPGQESWSVGTCTGQEGPRSYEVKVGESFYRRNRRQLIHAGEPRNTDTQDLMEQEVTTPQPEAAEPATTAATIPVPESQPDPPRRPQPKHRPPVRLNDYVPK